MIEIKTKTWKRDIMELFDFETSSVSLQNHTTNDDCRLVRKGSTTRLVTGFNQQDDESDSLACIYKQDGDFVVTFDKPILKNNQVVSKTQPAFLVVRSQRNIDGSSRGYRLKLGDLVKFGRAAFIVKEISTKTQQKQTLLEAPMQLKQGQNQEQECRICLENTTSSVNPMISACYCKGSIECIHLDCLRKCMSSKIKQCIKQNTFLYKWKNMRCDICNKQYSFNVQCEGKVQQIMRFQRPQGDYIALHGLTEGTQGLYFLSLSEGKNLSIGRNNDTDLFLNDITMSRQHAYLTLDEKGVIRIHDNKSKFGTLVQIRNPIKIKTQIVCQVGRSLICLSNKH